jgi:opacity protein-like surface antigen
MKYLFFIILFIHSCFYGYAQQMDSKWRFNLSGGMGYRTIDTSKDEKELTDMGFSAQSVSDCYNDLKWGIQGNTDVHYLFRPNFGIGIKYAFFYTDGKFGETVFSPPPSSGYSAIGLEMNEKDYLNYVGPSLHIRSFLGKSKFAVSTTLSGGYIHYRSNSEGAMATMQGYHNPNSGPVMVEDPVHPVYSAQQFAIRGNTFGMYGSAGLEYFFSKRIALGLDLGYFYSSLNDVTLTKKVDNNTTILQKVKLKDITGKKENLSRIDFSLGIKIYL